VGNHMNRGPQTLTSITMTAMSPRSSAYTNQLTPATQPFCAGSVQGFEKPGVVCGQPHHTKTSSTVPGTGLEPVRKFPSWGV
jgi:hypothetical protein